MTLSTLDHCEQQLRSRVGNDFKVGSDSDGESDDPLQLVEVRKSTSEHVTMLKKHAEYVFSAIMVGQSTPMSDATVKVEIGDRTDYLTILATFCSLHREYQPHKFGPLQIDATENTPALLKLLEDSMDSVFWTIGQSILGSHALVCFHKWTKDVMENIVDTNSLHLSQVNEVAVSELAKLLCRMTPERVTLICSMLPKLEKTIEPDDTVFDQMKHNTSLRQLHRFMADLCMGYLNIPGVVNPDRSSEEGMQSHQGYQYMRLVCAVKDVELMVGFLQQNIILPSLMNPPQPMDTDILMNQLPVALVTLQRKLHSVSEILQHTACKEIIAEGWKLPKDLMNITNWRECMDLRYTPRMQYTSCAGRNSTCLRSSRRCNRRCCYLRHKSILGVLLHCTCA